MIYFCDFAAPVNKRLQHVNVVVRTIVYVDDSFSTALERTKFVSNNNSAPKWKHL